MALSDTDHIYLFFFFFTDIGLSQEEVRKHFACPTLEGAELENQGTLGTALTHWEKRVFEVSRFRFNDVFLSFFQTLLVLRY